MFDVCVVRQVQVEQGIPRYIKSVSKKFTFRTTISGTKDRFFYTPCIQQLGIFMFFGFLFSVILPTFLKITKNLAEVKKTFWPKVNACVDARSWPAQMAVLSSVSSICKCSCRITSLKIVIPTNYERVSPHTHMRWCQLMGLFPDHMKTKKDPYHIHIHTTVFSIPFPKCI